MRSIPLLFASILTSCESKPEETGDTDTTSQVNTDAQFTYECREDDDWCSLESTDISLNEDQFSGYLDGDGQLTEESCSQLCQEETGMYYDYLCSCDYTGTDEQGMHPITCEYTVCAVEGRGHADIQKLCSATGKSALSRYFIRSYHAEASSVAAFLQLRAELEKHNTPQNLLDRCLIAAKEEVHHARMMAKFVKDCGAALPELNFGCPKSRDLYEIALDNAVEGCIFESYSALKAQYQAIHATDSRILVAMKMIAKDETKHAQLAWDIHHHLMTQLSDQEQQKIHQAQQKAFKESKP